MATPREVLFRTLQDYWDINHKDLARALLMETSVTSGKSPQELIETRSTLSRCVVHVRPGDYTFGWLAPYKVSVRKVMGLVRVSRRPHSSSDMVRVLSGEAALDMRYALESYSLDGALYANAVDRFSREGAMNTADASELLLALFVVTGASGDPAAGVEYAISITNQIAVPLALKTDMASDDDRGGPIGAVSLGMYRCEEDVLLSDVHRLNTDAQGTEIGSLSLAPHSFNDVGYGVSRRHARVWRDEVGVWWVEDLGSTNGTVHVDGDNGVATVVGAPRKRRGSEPSKQVRVKAGDRIILAGTTMFVFVALPAL